MKRGALERLESRANCVCPGTIRTAATGRAIRDLGTHLWTFDESGRVARFRHVADTHQHVAFRGA